jgi:hypothetical protein
MYVLEITRSQLKILLFFKHTTRRERQRRKTAENVRNGAVFKIFQKACFLKDASTGGFFFTMIMKT